MTANSRTQKLQDSSPCLHSVYGANPARRQTDTGSARGDREAGEFLALSASATHADEHSVPCKMITDIHLLKSTSIFYVAFSLNNVLLPKVGQGSGKKTVKSHQPNNNEIIFDLSN